MVNIFKAITRHPFPKLFKYSLYRNYLGGKWISINYVDSGKEFIRIIRQ